MLHNTYTHKIYNTYIHNIVNTCSAIENHVLQTTLKGKESAGTRFDSKSLFHLESYSVFPKL